MPIENPSGVLSGLNPDWPLGTDSKTTLDDHDRLIKDTLQKQFPGSGGQGFSKTITATEDELNYCGGLDGNIQEQLNDLLEYVNTRIEGYQANQTYANYGGDLNAISPYGVFSVQESQVTNEPDDMPAGSWGFLTHYAHADDTDYATQTMIGMTETIAGYFWMRSKNFGVWGDWFKLAGA